MKTRDKTLDYLRALAIFQVIFVHVLYWDAVISHEKINILKSWFLFEMPLFFFIIGACNSFKDVNNYFDFIRRRLLRILVPYWMFALICIMISIKCYDQIGIIEIVNITLSWLIPMDKQITLVPYIVNPLWFVSVYLCIVILIPILKYMKNSNRDKEFVFLILLLFIGISFFDMAWMQKVIFYSLWVYIGLFYNEIKTAVLRNDIRKKAWKLTGVGVFVICILSFVGYTLDMQYNKFPPNIMFFLYSYVVMSVILLGIPTLNKFFESIEKIKVFQRLVNILSTRSLTICLYQGFAFCFTIPLSNEVFQSSGAGSLILKLLFHLVVSVIGCILLAIVFGKIEDINVLKRNQKGI